MKCPYCGGSCINEEVAKLYLESVKVFFEFEISRADKELEELDTRKYPPVGDVGECKKTHGRIYLCPFCKEPFKATYEQGKITITCPNCKKVLCLPATNRTIC
ncbi:hypothetical protein [Methanocaldococcus infernus]|uniref:Uncharacterized protein n=1 Tax=Methanocaldococcus infernus (strain DSM 11812 / JCM 15783 / ME) TaxID=573063 RepID=D5VSC1_METIM|nr:hypothetical protein [Methanocaldococcus infernus]ADG13474.1 conserved hypothetical protein [Methanocaldococcus infernus ME]